MSNTFTSKLTQSRGWTIILGVAAAVLAAILLIFYLVQYRSSVNDAAADTPVLVAKGPIPKGASGAVIAEQQLYQTAELSKDDLKPGAISDPAYLQGRVATVDIYPGAQITTSMLSGATTSSLQTQITGKQRAVAIPVNGARGLVGFVADGDRVDIYYETGSAGGNLLALLAPNVLILRAPTVEGAATVLRAPAALAQDIALASDSGTMWFLLRPTVGAKEPPKRFITAQELLARLTSQQKKG